MSVSSFLALKKVFVELRKTFWFHQLPQTIACKSTPALYSKVSRTRSENSTYRASIVLKRVRYGIGVFQTTCEFPNTATLSVWKETGGYFTFRLTWGWVLLSCAIVRNCTAHRFVCSVNLHRDKQNTVLDKIPIVVWNLNWLALCLLSLRANIFKPSK